LFNKKIYNFNYFINNKYSINLKKNSFLNWYFLKFNLKLTSRIKFFKKNFDSIFLKNYSYSYIHFINFFIKEGKFLKVFNVFNFIYTHILFLFNNDIFLNSLTQTQKNGISFFQSNIHSRVDLLFMPSFLFFGFENLNLMFTYKFVQLPKITQKKKTKKYEMDYAYIAPKYRLFKLVQIWKKYCNFFQKRHFVDRLLYALLDIFLDNNNSFIWKFKKKIITFILQRHVRKIG